MLVARLTAITGLAFIGWPTLRGRPVQKPCPCCRQLRRNSDRCFHRGFTHVVVSDLPLDAASFRASNAACSSEYSTGLGDRLWRHRPGTSHHHDGTRPSNFSRSSSFLLLTAWLIGRTQGRLRAMIFPPRRATATRGQWLRTAYSNSSCPKMPRRSSLEKAGLSPLDTRKSPSSSPIWSGSSIAEH